MNKFALATATPAFFILADWANHENEAGYNVDLARGLSMFFIITALALFLKGQHDQVVKDKKEAEARAEKIRAMLQKSIDRNLGKGN